MSVQVHQKNLCMCTLMMLVGTLGFIIAHMVASWAEHQEGSITLWKDCLNLNITCPNGRPVQKCRPTAFTGPAWLEVCRTLACLTLILFMKMLYTHHIAKTLPTPNTIWTHIQARQEFILYFIIGAMMLTSSTMYLIKFKDHYTDKGKGEGLKPGFSVIAAMVGGIIALLNSIFMSYHADTGLMAYLKQKLKCCSNSNSSVRQTQRDNGVEVKTRCARIVMALRCCCGKNPERNNNSNNIDNDNVGERPINQQAAIENTTVRRRNQTTLGQTVVTVESPSENTNRPPTQNREITSNGVVARQRNEFNASSSAQYDTLSSAASIQRLNVQVRSTQGSYRNTHRDNFPAPAEYIPPILQLPEYQLEDSSSPPPSYDEIIKSDSKC